MKNLAITVISALFLFSGILATPTQADQQEMASGQERSDQQGERRGPPPEAYTACEGKSSGVSAQMVTPQGDTQTGTCETERDGTLVLRPYRAGNNNHGKRCDPPPEAYIACEGKTSGDSAQLTTPRGETLSGRCEKAPDGRLVLRPDQTRSRHRAD